MKRPRTVKEEHLKEFGKRLKAIREELGMKQKEFATSLHVSDSYICQIEKGNANPTFEFFHKLVSRMNVNLNYLFYGEGETYYRRKKGEGGEGLEDIKDSIESKEDVHWFMEHSGYFSMSMVLCGKRLLIDGAEYIKKDLEKVFKKGKKPDQE